MGTGCMPSMWCVELNGGFSSDEGDTFLCLEDVCEGEMTDASIPPLNAASTSWSQTSISKSTAPGGQFPPIEWIGEPEGLNVHRK